MVTPKLLVEPDEKTEFEWYAPPGVFRHLILGLHTSLVGKKRIKIQYGSYVTGSPWDKDAWDHGRLSKSTGPKKILILVHNQRSMDGQAVLIKNIVAIKYSNKREGNVIWVHPLYPFLQWDFTKTYMIHMRFHSVRFELPRMYRCVKPVPYL